MERPGPGLLLAELAGGKDPALEAALRVISAIDADVLLLTAVDYDRGLVLGRLLTDRLAQSGPAYPHVFALRPNAGMATGLDLDGDGRTGGPGDAQGWGRFSGQGGMLLLSRLPFDTLGLRDFSAFLWRDLPGHMMPPDTPATVREVQRLASTNHFELPLILPDGDRLRLLVWHATPPVFDGPEDRNGRRNHDEAAFWLALLDGVLPFPAPEPPFVLLGDANLDPADGEGRPEAIRALLAHSLLQDPAPRGEGRAGPSGHRGDPALDTAFYPELGGLRLDYVMPGAGLEVLDAALLDGAGQPALAADLALASHHLPVWVDLALPGSGRSQLRCFSENNTVPPCGSLTPEAASASPARDP